MPSYMLKEAENGKAANLPKKQGHYERCVECWGVHPRHKFYCSWSVGSRAAEINIVAPSYRNPKDQKVELNGGYAGVSRHVASNIWGTTKPKDSDEKAPEQPAKVETEACEDADWVKVEGDWVEI